MWYVNVLIQEKLTEKITSFILTMWYVNLTHIIKGSITIYVLY